MNALVTLALVLCIGITTAQTKIRPLVGGLTFTLNVPSYLSKTAGINSAAALQFKSVVKDIYGIVIYDTKEELLALEMNFNSARDFYDNFITDFVKDEEQRTVSDPKSKTKNGISFWLSDLSYFDKDAKTKIYYKIGVAETSKAFYKILIWCDATKRKTFEDDFEACILSLVD